MLDIVDFIKDRGGDPEKVRESQRRRHAPEQVVDEVIALYEETRRSMSIDCLQLQSDLTSFNSSKI